LVRVPGASGPLFWRFKLILALRTGVPPRADKTWPCMVPRSAGGVGGGGGVAAPRPPVPEPRPDAPGWANRPGESKSNKITMRMRMFGIDVSHELDVEGGTVVGVGMESTIANAIDVCCGPPNPD